MVIRITTLFDFIIYNIIDFKIKTTIIKVKTVKIDQLRPLLTRNEIDQLNFECKINFYEKLPFVYSKLHFRILLHRYTLYIKIKI